jgi:hypothetical protein
MQHRSLLLVTVAAALAAPAAAYADGGASIAAAPPVVIAQQQIGNTATGGQSPDVCGTNFRSWWALPVTAGDHIAVDWESQDSSATLNLWPVGTTDFTFPDTQPAASSELNDNLKAELTYTAPRTGNLPLELFHGACSTGDPGPYDFVVSVKHTVRLALARVHRVARTGIMKVSVRNPDGVGVTAPALQVVLQARNSNGTWRSVGHAAPANGVARVGYRLPKQSRSKVVFRVRASGGAYVTATSASLRAAVR